MVNLLSTFQNVPNLRQDVNYCYLIIITKIRQEDSFTALEKPRLLLWNVFGSTYAEFDKEQTFEFKRREIC